MLRHQWIGFKVLSCLGMIILQLFNGWWIMQNSAGLFYEQTNAFKWSPRNKQSYFAQMNTVYNFVAVGIMFDYLPGRHNQAIIISLMRTHLVSFTMSVSVPRHWYSLTYLNLVVVIACGWQTSKKFGLRRPTTTFPVYAIAKETTYPNISR